MEKVDLAPSPGRWYGPPSPRRWTPTRTLVGAAFLLAVVLCLIFRSGIPLIPPLVFVFQYVVFVVQYGTHRARTEDLRLLEDPDDPDVCLVELTVYCNKESIGEDRGVVWFKDGLLLYSGHRTSFAIGGEDVLPVDQWPTWPYRRGEGELPDRIVALRHACGTVAVELRPLRTQSVNAGEQEMCFLNSLYEFRRRPPQSRGPRQWPPFEP